MDCKEFLQRALPRLGLRARGFARVQHQVCKRIARRMAELRLGGFEEYWAYLEVHDEEWSGLDELCHVTISRFFRDGEVFEALATQVIPRLCTEALQRGERRLRFWSAGCGAGEEPYSLSMLWRFGLAQRYPELALEIVATDADAGQLQRARAGVYRTSSLREVPADLRAQAFESVGPDSRRVNDDVRSCVRFLQQDLRREAPQGPFSLVLCRNLAFSYFDEQEQERVLSLVAGRLCSGGVLVVGRGEQPARACGFEAVGLYLFQRST